MPPRKTRCKKRKTKGKKKSYYKKRRGVYTLADRFLTGARKRGRSALKGAKKRGSAAARYAYKNPEEIVGAGAGAAGLGLASYEGYLAAKRGMDVMNSRFIDLPEGAEDPYASPTAAAFRRGRRGVTATRDYFTNPNRNIRADIAGGAYSAAEGADEFVRSIPRRGAGLLNRMFPRRNEDNMQTFLGASSKKLKKEKINAERNQANFPGIASLGYGKRRRRRSSYKFGEKHEKCHHNYGKRRRRRSSYKFGEKHEKCHHNYGKRRRRRRSFGKKVKKPSAATKRMCKKLKVRLTLKRGGKRVYKSEAMLKKQCKKAMKRKKKK